MSSIIRLMVALYFLSSICAKDVFNNANLAILVNTLLYVTQGPQDSGLIRFPAPIRSVYHKSF